MAEPEVDSRILCTRSVGRSISTLKPYYVRLRSELAATPIEGGDEDAHEQHRADRHAGDDAGHGAVNSEHVVVQPAKDVSGAHGGSDDGCAGERDGTLLQVAYAPNFCELRIDLAPVGVRAVLDVLSGALLEL
eukprot:scaffold21899_cov63-Phaeocystis_antarctica.AAC.5